MQKAKENYYKIGSISCPAFGGEKVYFNRHGWAHFIQKGRKKRDLDERVKRINLLKFAPQVIAVVRSLADNIEVVKGNSRVHFWAAHQKIDGLRIRVVIRQCNNGRKHFLSIMEE